MGDMEIRNHPNFTRGQAAWMRKQEAITKGKNRMQTQQRTDIKVAAAHLAAELGEDYAELPIYEISDTLLEWAQDYREESVEEAMEWTERNIHYFI